MESVQLGFLSILPPIIAIALALITKEVISSLLVGILSGAFIYSLSTGRGVLGAIEVVFSVMSEKIGLNAYILIFLSLLGGLIVVVTKAGGSQAYAEWTSSKIKSRALAQVSTCILGILIFIDDYFNCLTVGTVMRPVTDKQKISRAKLAYIVHSTAAPICILVPISSWAASVISYMDGTGLNGMETFVKTIPYNLYPILAIILVFIMSLKDTGFGPMYESEDEVEEVGALFSDESSDEADKEYEDMQVSSKGKVIDLIIPIASLIIFSLLSMLKIGGYFNNSGIGLFEAFGNTNASLGITYGAFVALIISFIMFVPRRLISFKEFMKGIYQGMKSMVPAFVILALAWTISGICRDLIGTGDYVEGLVANSNIPVIFIPCLVFALAGFLAFAMGTSWGTFGILIPIVAMVCEKVTPGFTTIALSATLAGAVFGDNSSPISDTTVLSATSAGCDHMKHVSTQLPYSLLAAIISFIGYIIAAFTLNPFITLGICIVLLIVSVNVLHRFYIKHRKIS